jgi:hypothetical protein
MKKIIHKYSALNNTKVTVRVSIVLILYVNYLVITGFVKFQSLNLNLDNPLIPQEYISDIFASYAKVGLVLSIGLMLILLLKFRRQNLIVILGAVVLIGFYYLTDQTTNWNN